MSTYFLFLDTMSLLCFISPKETYWKNSWKNTYKHKKDQASAAIKYFVQCTCLQSFFVLIDRVLHLLVTECYQTTESLIQHLLLSYTFRLALHIDLISKRIDYKYLTSPSLLWTIFSSTTSLQQQHHSALLLIFSMFRANYIHYHGN